MARRGTTSRRAVSPELPVAVAARAAIAENLDVLTREIDAARAGKVDGVHQVRVATRRLRATLVLFGDALPRRAADALERELAGLGRAVGPVRDLDVLAVAVAARARKIDPALEPAVATIVRHIREHRTTAHALLASTLDAATTRRLVDRLAALARQTPQASAPCATVAGDLVRPLVRDLRRAGRKADADASEAALHRVRIRAKQLRYALETLEGLGGDAARVLARRLTDLQHALGDQRDATNQRAWLLGEVPAFLGDAEVLVAVGAIGEALRRRARRFARRAPRAWRRVDRKLLDAMLDELGALAHKRKAA